MTSPGRRWLWYGGRPSLDFVNTCRNREAGRRAGVAEYLREPADFAAWLDAAGLVPAGQAVDEETLAGALALREAIDAAVAATVAAGRVPEDAVRCVNEWITAGPERPVLRIEAGVAVLSAPRAARTPRGALALIAADAAELLGTGLRDRLRICPGPGCRGRFLDDSPAGRRRWCSMAVCGNRSKAAAYRHAAAGLSPN
ncbi:MAG TPA: ABATE domain-containing protein [Streptosporangiaceae bacterium]